MSIPKPRVGMVFRHSFLFSNGVEKERPAVIVIAVDPYNTGDPNRVAVMPITHSLPRESNTMLEIPTRLKNHLGLDDDRSWVVLNEINEFDWPGPDIRRIPRTTKWEYGQIPSGFYNQLKARSLELEGKNRLKIQDRDEGEGTDALSRPLFGRSTTS